MSLAFAIRLAAMAFLLQGAGRPDAARAQSALRDAQPISIGDTLTLHSAILNEDRRVMVHLPPGYRPAGKRHYPVLYLLDGEDHFEHVSGIVDYLSDRGRMPAAIVVGVVNTVRSRDLTPSAKNTHVTFEMIPFQARSDEDISDAGGADRFLGFLKTELAPAIEARYRTAPFRILVGHSFGGLFVAHVLLTDPDAFDAYLGASPSLWWDDEALIRKAARMMPSLGKRPHWLYLSTGEEGGEMLGALDDLKAVLTLAHPATLDWDVHILPGETHATTPHRVFYDGLTWLFRDYAIDENIMMGGDLDRVERHFADASRRYGFDLSPNEAVINDVAYSLLRSLKRPAQALVAFRRNVALHPSSPGAYDSLADGLEANGLDREALANRDKTVSLAVEANDPHLDDYRKNRDRLAAKLSQPPPARGG